MKIPITLIINGLCALGVGWLYGADALDAMRAQSAEVSAYLQPPNLVFALGALLAAGVGVGATVLGVVQKRDRAWRGFRLLPIVTVVVLFVDVFFFAAARSPLDSSDRTALTVHTFAEQASQLSSLTAVSTSPPQLQQLADKLGPPPYLVRGEPAKAWAVVVRQGCTGPVTQMSGEPLGTLFYCVAAEAKGAWVTAATLPVGVYFGAPQLFAKGGEPIVGAVVVRVPDEPEEAPDEPGLVDPGESPLPLPFPFIETADGGR